MEKAGLRREGRVLEAGVIKGLTGSPKAGKGVSFLWVLRHSPGGRDNLGKERLFGT